MLIKNQKGFQQGRDKMKNELFDDSKNILKGYKKTENRILEKEQRDEDESNIKVCWWTRSLCPL